MAGRYAVKLTDGTRVTLTPANLARADGWLTDEEPQSNSGGGAFDLEDVQSSAVDSEDCGRAPQKSAPCSTQKAIPSQTQATALYTPLWKERVAKQACPDPRAPGHALYLWSGGDTVPPVTLTTQFGIT